MLGFGSEVRKYLKLLSDENRYKDIAIQFYEQKRVDGQVLETGKASKVHGGKCDIWSGEYVGEAETVHRFGVSPKQYALIHDECPRIEVNGGRGSAKSYAGCLWVLRKIVECCGIKCEVVGSVHRVTRDDWDKILSILPLGFLMPGNAGIRRSDKELHLINGSYIRFMSAKNILSLRSWGGHCAFIDEEQDVKQEAIDVVWPSLRLAVNPQMLSSGTPMRGEYEQRHKKNLAEQEKGEPFSCHRFESYDNFYVPTTTFDLAKKQMDVTTYNREILADWGALDDGEPLVFRCFSREKHGVSTLKGYTDITLSYTKKRMRVARPFIIGVDPNWDYPNYAVIYKVFKPNIWIAIDIVSSMGHCGDLGQALIDRGYRHGVIVSDASGRYNRGPKSSDRLMRAKGFTVTHDFVNPFVTDSVDGMLIKMDPMHGEISWFLKLPECVELAEAMEILLWGKTGKKFDKNAGVDHVIDAARYPVSFFEPVRVKRLKIK